MSPLGDALGDALARIHEFDGADIREKLAVLGVDAEQVAEVLEERIDAHASSFEHADDDDSEQVAFIKGFVEGLIAAAQVKRGG